MMGRMRACHRRWITHGDAETASNARGSRFSHAARVAAVTALIVASAYAVVGVVFDLVDGQRLVAQVDSHIRDRLDDVIRAGGLQRPRGEEDDDHDVDAVPVVLWQVAADGATVRLSDNAPALPAHAWARNAVPTTAPLGSESFRLLATRIGSGWLVAGQSLADTVRVESVVDTAEIIAGPVIVLAAFLAALVIGLQASRPVEDARRRQLEFTADASHELRTPLSVIEAEVSLSLQSRRTADDYHATLEHVGAEGRRLRHIIEDLLWLARFDSEPAPPKAEAIDLGSVVRACAERFGAVARAGGITLSVQGGSGGVPWVMAPPDWIDRLVGVLVDNACRHAGVGGRVVVDVSATGNRVVLSVEDTGPGIPPEERSRLFDRFHRVSEDGSGTGLGLAIADSVVRSTGGRWRVSDSALGGAFMEVSWHRSHFREPGTSPGTAGADRATPTEPADQVGLVD